MKLHSRTEKATFFLEGLCEIFCKQWVLLGLMAIVCKQWVLLGLMAIVWLSILAQTESSMFLAFFTGFHTALTIVMVGTMVFEAKLTAKKKQWYDMNFTNNATGQTYKLVLPPSVSPYDLRSIAHQIDGQF